jgi:alpha-galactosidase
LDDGWTTKERDEYGNLVPDPVKFPSGMKALVDYVHSKGLKFGLYNCAGTKTCAGYPGSRGHEYQDARF